MKKSLRPYLLGTLLLLSAGALAGCGNEGGSETKEQDLLNFAAVTGTEWDTQVTIDSKAYNLAVNVKKDSKLEVVGTCKGKVEANQGGQGGGFPGPMGAEEVTSESEVDSTDYSQFNFSIPGTWTEEKGYGYTFNIKNETIHVNYDKTAGRQWFYFTPSVTIGGEEKVGSQTKFEAKDSAYRKTLAADYKIWEERNAQLMFCGGAEGGSGNLSTAWIYLLPEAKLVSMSGTSNSISYNNVGTWSEDKAAHSVSMDVNGTKVETNGYCDTPGKEGYRCSYAAPSSGPGGGGGSITMYASCDISKFTWDQYVTEDFEGKVEKTLNGQGEYADYTLELTEKGYANVKTGGKTSMALTYTKAEGGNIVVVNGDESFNSTLVDGKLSIEIHWSYVTGFGPFKQTVDVTATFIEA